MRTFVKATKTLLCSNSEHIHSLLHLIQGTPKSSRLLEQGLNQSAYWHFSTSVKLLRKAHFPCINLTSAHGASFRKLSKAKNHLSTHLPILLSRPANITAPSPPSARTKEGHFMNYAANTSLCCCMLWLLSAPVRISCCFSPNPQWNFLSCTTSSPTPPHGLPEIFLRVVCAVKLFSTFPRCVPHSAAIAVEPKFHPQTSDGFPRCHLSDVSPYRSHLYTRPFFTSFPMGVSCMPAKLPSLRMYSRQHIKPKRT